MPKFEIFWDKAGEARWQFRGGNGEIMATSEGYRDFTDARRGVADFVEGIAGILNVASPGLSLVPVQENPNEAEPEPDRPDPGEPVSNP